MESFCINDLFRVEPASNLLTNLSDGSSVAIEGRVMNVLCLLASGNGNVVTREDLVSKVWNDYGGGDEGLNQAVSALRRSLGDTQKELIKTILKKGYIFTGMLSAPPALNQDNQGIIESPFPGRKPTLLSNALQVTFLLIAVIWCIWMYRSREIKDNNRQVVPFSNELAPDGSVKETPENTLVTKPDESTTYKVIFYRSQPYRFFLNGAELPESQWDPYMLIIDDMTKQFNLRSH